MHKNTGPEAAMESPKPRLPPLSSNPVQYVISYINIEIIIIIYDKKYGYIEKFLIFLLILFHESNIIIPWHDI